MEGLIKTRNGWFRLLLFLDSLIVSLLAPCMYLWSSSASFGIYGSIPTGSSGLKVYLALDILILMSWKNFNTHNDVLVSWIPPLLICICTEPRNSTQSWFQELCSHQTIVCAHCSEITVPERLTHGRGNSLLHSGWMGF